MVHNKGLAKSGAARHKWAADHMRTLAVAAGSFGTARPLGGVRIGFCLQVTAETSALIMAAKKLGAQVVACAGNPHTTQDDIAAYLASSGAAVYAWRGQTRSEFHRCIRRVMDDSPDILVDDGGELSILAHTRYADLPVLGATEETTTGVRRIRALGRRTALRYPIIAVNDARTKAMFDNVHGTGQSAIDALLRTCGVLFASKSVIVAGYGPVGRGVASRCAELGARVSVTEVDPVRALEAHMAGYDVQRMDAAARTGQIFITCTGQRSVITARHISAMRDGAILANVGHFDVEIDVAALGRMAHSKRRIRRGLDEFTMRTGRRILLVSGGYVANLVSASGNPPEIMALSFANQIRCIVHLARHGRTAEPGIFGVSSAIDGQVARDALAASGVRIDG